MQALVCEQYGDPELLVLRQLDEPEPGPGEVAIRVSFAGVSFVDTLMIRNLHQNPHPLPFVPGMEVAGTVDSVGRDVEGVRAGDRVAALVYDGGYAEVAVAKASECLPLPSAASLETAAAMLSVYLTAYLALVEEAKVRAGEWVAISGASGGVGTAAVELTTRLGANALGVVGDLEKAPAIESRGGRVVCSDPIESLRDALVERAGPNGVDVVLDPVAGPVFEPLFRSLGWGGRYLSIGFAAGSIPEIRANLLLVKNRSALGFALMHYRKHRVDRLQAAAKRLFGWLAGGEVAPYVSAAVELHDAPTRLREILDRNTRGKGVVAVGSLAAG